MNEPADQRPGDRERAAERHETQAALEGGVSRYVLEVEREDEQDAEHDEPHHETGDVRRGVSRFAEVAQRKHRLWTDVLNAQERDQRAGAASKQRDRQRGGEAVST